MLVIPPLKYALFVVFLTFKPTEASHVRTRVSCTVRDHEDRMT